MKKIWIISVLIMFSIISFCFEEERFKSEIKRMLVDYNISGISIYIDLPESEDDVEIRYGFSDFHKNIWMAKGTKFRVGSLTKSFTATAILILHDRKMLNIEDEVKQYLNLDTKFLDDIRIIDLMNMSSGLRDYINDEPEENGFILNHLIDKPKGHLTQEQLLKRAFEITDLLGIEEEFHYNNTNYILLGMIIEKVTNEKYEDFIENNIIIPLGLKNTIVPETHRMFENMAKGYHDLINDDPYFENSEINPSYVWSAGSIISNAKDISKWFKELSKGTLLEQSSKKFLFEGQYIIDNVYYTSGVIYDNGKIWHNGVVIGYNSKSVYYIDKDLSITVILNGVPEINLIDIIIDNLTENYL